MFCFVGLCFGMLVRLFRERRSLLLENLALRQQLVALKRRHPRPCLGVFDKFFWGIARRVCSAWKQRHEDIAAAVIEGAVHRLRPKLMTVFVVLANLIPILWETGVGAD